MTANFKVLNAGTLRTITRGYVRQAGVLRQLKTAKVMDGGVLRTVGIFVQPLALSITPTTVLGIADATGTATTGTAQAVPAGGFSPYTYLWSHVSGVTATILSPTLASTAFRRVLGVEFETAVFRCTVTDSVGGTAQATVNATFREAIDGGGTQ